MKRTPELAGTPRVDVAPIASMSIGQVRERLAEIRVMQARLDAETLALNARMLSLLDDPIAPMVVIPEHELVAHGGLTTRVHIDALGRGLRIAGDQRAAFLAHLPELVDASTHMSAADFGQLVKRTANSVVIDDGLSRFERQQRETFLSMRTDDEGCLHVRGKFDPISAAILTNNIGSVVEAMFHTGDKEVALKVMPWVNPNEHRQGRALIALLSDSDADRATGIARAEVVVHIDLDTLRSGRHAASVCRTSAGADVPVVTVRRLACDAASIPVVFGGASVPIDVERSRSLATANQRRALEAIHTSYAVPDCGAGFDRCRIHHVDHWENGGATDLGNLLPLCHAHHRAVHEGRCSLG